MKQIYLDNAATTSTDPAVFAAMKPYFLTKYGNASEPHLYGQQARIAVEAARAQVAKFLGAKPGEVIFTGSATESINLAHKGLIEAITPLLGGKKSHIITTSIEHKAVLESCRHLQDQGLAEVTLLPVDEYGVVKMDELKRAIREETVLVSIMYVNNEVGTIQPIKEISQILKKINDQRTMNHQPKVFFHTDATQAIQYLPCNADELGADLLSLTGHKFHAPKGVGALYVRSGTPLIKQMDGGSQEKRLRAGTENVPYIVALGKAMEKVTGYRPSALRPSLRLEELQGTGDRVQEVTKLRNHLVQEVLKIPGVRLTGHPTLRSPHIASFVIEGVEGEAVLLMLSEKGVMASTGSACTSGSLEPSHVLSAMGFAPEISHGSLRLSLDKSTTEEEVEYVAKILPEIVERLRLMAPKL